MGEVIQLSDRVTIFRDGENAGDLAKEEINHENMVSLMVGRDLSEFYNRQIHQPGRTVLQAREIISPAYSTIPVSFEVRAGEIVGIAGLVGAGRTELLETIFGVTPALAGELELDGKSFRPLLPGGCNKCGYCLGT